jgi:hypothetical protein
MPESQLLHELKTKITELETALLESNVSLLKIKKKNLSSISVKFAVEGENEFKT